MDRLRRNKSRRVGRTLRLVVGTLTFSFTFWAAAGGPIFAQGAGAATGSHAGFDRLSNGLQARRGDSASSGAAKRSSAPQAGRSSLWNRMPAALYGPIMPPSYVAPNLTAPGQNQRSVLSRGPTSPDVMPAAGPRVVPTPAMGASALPLFSGGPASTGSNRPQAPSPDDLVAGGPAGPHMGASAAAPKSIKPLGATEAPPWLGTGASAPAFQGPQPVGPAPAQGVFGPAAPLPAPQAAVPAKQPAATAQASPAAAPRGPLSAGALNRTVAAPSPIVQVAATEVEKAPSEGEAIEPEPASLKGIQPGHSSQADLDELWDVPKELEQIEGGQRRIYRLEPFEAVEVEVYKGVVKSILVNLRKPLAADALARDLKLGFIEPVIVASPEGDALGQAFPERGVLFTFDPAAPKQFHAQMPVRQIVLERIQPESFVLRAELNMGKNYRRALADLQQALKLSPDDVRARWLQAQVAAAAGSYQEAVDALEQVIARDPERPEYRLALAKVLSQSGRTDQAVEAMTAAIPKLADGTLAKAEAQLLLGQMKGTAVPPDWKGSMEQCQAAAKTAQALLKGEAQVDRPRAAQVALEGTVGVAVSIAWGPWKGKEQVVPKWLDKAAALIAAPLSDEQQAAAKYLLARKSLAAYVGMEADPPSDAWVKTVLEYGEKQVDAAADPLQRAATSWELGTALHDALQCQLTAEQYDAAVEYGAKAVHYLEQGLSAQKHVPGNEYLLGRACFRLGSAYVAGKSDLPTAMIWFEKALPLLDKPLPPGADEDVGRQGETFVCIGVASWQSGKKEVGLDLVVKGMELMHTAVEKDLLDASDMIIPCRNLSMMYRGLGNNEKADQAQKLADMLEAEAEEEAKKAPPSSVKLEGGKTAPPEKTAARDKAGTPTAGGPTGTPAAGSPPTGTPPAAGTPAAGPSPGAAPSAAPPAAPPTAAPPTGVPGMGQFAPPPGARPVAAPGGAAPTTGGVPGMRQFGPATPPAGDPNSLPPEVPLGRP